MNSFLKIYRRNIYSIIGTLIFHILLLSAFLLSDITLKGKAKEEVILIEFPELLPEEEISENEESNENQNLDNSNANISNIASSQLATEKSVKSVDDFLDNEFLKEIEEARKLVSDVKNQLSKETVDIEDIQMPVHKIEGLDADSIKNIAYTGESNIKYYLEDRYVLSLPVPIYLSQRGGLVIVDIEVNRNGKVTMANPRETENRNEQISNYARAAALKTIFNSDNNAPQTQKGSIHYTFISQ